MKKIYVGGAFTSIAAIIAAWVAVGVGGPTASTSTCPLPAYPDATCTGIPAGVTPTTPTLDGDNNYPVNTANTTVEAIDVPGCILVNQPGVTIKNSRARCVIINDNGAGHPPQARLTIQDSEIDCGQREGLNPLNSGIFGQNFNAYRNNITNCENGMFAGDEFTARDNFIHNLYNAVENDPHTDGIQVYDAAPGAGWNGGGDNVVIEHNTIYGFSDGCVYPGGQACNGTSAIIYNNVPAGTANDAPVQNVTIKDNLLAGGSVALYCPREAVSDFQTVRNHFSTIYSPNVGEFGPSTSCSTAGNLVDGGDPGGEDHIGNVIHQTGLPVTLG